MRGSGAIWIPTVWSPPAAKVRRKRTAPKPGAVAMNSYVPGAKTAVSSRLFAEAVAGAFVAGSVSATGETRAS